MTHPRISHLLILIYYSQPVTFNSLVRRSARFRTTKGESAALENVSTTKMMMMIGRGRNRWNRGSKVGKLAPIRNRVLPFRILSFLFLFFLFFSFYFSVGKESSDNGANRLKTRLKGNWLGSAILLSSFWLRLSSHSSVSFTDGKMYVRRRIFV